MLPGSFEDSGGMVARQYDLRRFDCRREVGSGALANRSGPLKTEMSPPAVHRLADDHVINC